MNQGFGVSLNGNTIKSLTAGNMRKFDKLQNFKYSQIKSTHK